MGSARPEVDAATELAPWFVAGLPRPALKLVATQLLSKGQVGDFIVRDVKTDPNCFGLTVKVLDRKLINFIIEPFSLAGAQAYEAQPAGALGYDGLQVMLRGLRLRGRLACRQPIALHYPNVASLCKKIRPL